MYVSKLHVGFLIRKATRDINCLRFPNLIICTMKPSYHQYQQIIDLDKKIIKTKTKRKSAGKSRNGCFTCKKRKKKCDEKKPACSYCSKSSNECKYPDIVQTNKLDFVFENFDNNDYNLLKSISNFDLLFDSNDDFLLDQFLDINSENNLLKKKYKNDVNIEKKEHFYVFKNPQLSIPGIEFNLNELICYDAFLNILIKSIDLLSAHCSPERSPTNLILPFIQKNKTVREVAFACGASSLASRFDSFKNEAVERYNQVIVLLIEELKDPKSNFDDGIFVCVQLLQLLCFRDKNSSFNMTLFARHFNSSHAIIKKRFLRATLLASKNDLIFMKPLDRLLIEQFIFFYPLNIMLCHSSKLKDSIPSPFHFFGTFYHLLKKPVEVNLNSWEYHPVVGISLKAHEISAKCSWICRLIKFPIKEDELITCSSLLIEAKSELKRISNALNDSLNPFQKANIHYSKTILYSSSILLEKICFYENTSIESLQEIVDLLIEQENFAKLENPERIPSLWAMFIGVCTANTIQKRNLFCEILEDLAARFDSIICNKILNYINTVWVDIEENEGKYNGFEFLFDTKVLDIITN